MEGSILAKGNHQGGSSLMSEPDRSVIKIDSISIDLANGNEKNEADKCEHFSIRGYVAEIRKKDSKICWPFSKDGKHIQSEEQICMLPPLHVAKFRWWRCKNCLNEIGVEGTTKETGSVPNCCNIGFESGSTHSHRCDGNVAQLLSDFQQASKVDNFEKRKVDAATSTDVNLDEHCVLSCHDTKGKKSGIACMLIMGYENGSEDVVNQETPIPTCGLPKVNPCLMSERHKDGTVAVRSECNGFVESSDPNPGGHGVTDNGLTIRGLKCMASSSSEICQTRKVVSVDEQHKELTTACGTSEVVGVVHGDVPAANGHITERPSRELDNHDCATSEGDDILVGNSLQDQHLDNSGIFHHRKTRKVRLLAELLDAGGNGRSDHIRIKDAPANAFAGDDLISVPHSQVAVPGNARKGSGQNRKRKMPRDDNYRPQEKICTNHVNPKVGIYEADVETTTIATAVLKSEEDASAGIGLEVGMKNHLAKRAIDRDPIVNKKKIKNIQIEAGCSSQMPLQEVVPKENHNKIGDSDNINAADAVYAPGVSKGRVMDPLIKSFFLVPQIERKSTLYKKKNQKPQVENVHASLMPWSNGVLRESPTPGKNVEFTRTGPEVLQFQSAHDASTGKCPYLSLGGYFSSQINGEKGIGDRLDSLLTQRDRVFGGDQTLREDVGIKCVGDSSVPLKSSAGAIFDHGMHCNLNIKGTKRKMPSISEKRNSAALADDGDCSLMPKMDFSGTCNIEKTIGVQENPEISKRHRDQRADKMFEQGAIDDIPMEIVELMAKNQYERRLHDAENNHCLMGTTYRPKNGEMMDFAKGGGNGALRLLQGENPHLQNPQSTNARKDIFTTVDNVGSSKQKSISCFPQMGLPEGTHGSRGFGIFSGLPERLSSGIQFSVSGSSTDFGAHNYRWDGDTMGQRFSSSLQGSKAYDTCPTMSQQSEKGTGVWPSMITSHMPCGLNTSQKCAPQSINKGMISQCLGTQYKGKMNGDHDLKFLDLNVANLEQQNGNFGSETFNKTQVEYPFSCSHKGIEIQPETMGSLDIYSNETIPAMHLLSLMDAGLQSRTPFNMDGSIKPPRRPSFLHEHHSKEFSGQEMGVTSHTSRHPSSDYYGRNHFPEKSCECFPAVPRVGAFGSSFQNDVTVRRAPGFGGDVPLKTREKGKEKRCSPTQNRGCKSQKSASKSVDLGMKHGSIHLHNTQKRFPSPSGLMACPSQSCAIEDSTKRTKLDAHSSYGTVLPMKSSSRAEICSVNRNPADFCLPEVRNRYMIGAEDLKFGRTNCSKDRSGLISVDGRKRQRVTKLTAVKGRARRHMS